MAGDEDTSVQGSSAVASPKSKAALGAFALFGLLYSNCIGSGYGFEDAVRTGGPLVTILACVLIPILWTFPTALTVAELASQMPSNAGSAAWIQRVFHPVVSYYNIFTTIFINILANASLISLTANYFQRILLPSPQTLAPWAMALANIVTAVGATVLNVIGIEVVGTASIVMSILTLSPFILMTLVGFIKFPQDASALSYVPADIGWPTFLTIVTWNFGSIDNAGAVIEDVKQPNKTLILALIPLMISYAPSYLLPVIVGVSAVADETHQPGGDYAKWKSGYWTHVARVIGSDWLRGIMLAGSIVSGAGYAITMLCATSKQLQGIAKLDVFPQRIGQLLGSNNARLGTPVVSILLHSVIALIICLSMPFDNLVAAQQVLYVLRLCLIYMALVKSRYMPITSTAVAIGDPTPGIPDFPDAADASSSQVVASSDVYRMPFRSAIGAAAFLTPAFVISALTAFCGMQQAPAVLYICVGVLVVSLFFGAVAAYFAARRDYQHLEANRDEQAPELGK